MQTEGYKLLVSGYREFENYDFFVLTMAEIMRQRGKPSQVLQGECPTGADRLAKRWCIENNVFCVPFPADWSKGKRGGPERNSVMLDKADVVCAFVHKKSKGTKDVIKKAKAKRLPLYEVNITNHMQTN
jgi:hypothetical protein